jgi:hypothetical protein
VEIAILLKAIYMFSAIPIKIPMTFCTELEKSILKYIWRHKRPWIVKPVLSKKFNAGGKTIPDFIQHYRAITIKAPQFWHKNRLEYQWIRIENQDINPCIDGQMIFDKGAQNTQWKKRASSTNTAGKIGYPHVEDWN